MQLRSTLAPLALAGVLAACADTPTAPLAAPAARSAATVAGLKSGRLATIEFAGRWPALYIQDAAGKDRFRVSFTNVHDKIPGNYPPEMLPITDRTILALGPAKWSPDGQQLAVIAAVAYDQSVVLVMDADGRNIRVASPNSQVIMGDIDWSPDSRRIAYAMSTNFHARDVDLFVTDLVKDEVQRITADGRFGVYDEYRWDPTSTGLWFTNFESWTDDQRETVRRVYHATLDGRVTGVPQKIVGNPQGIARDGSWAIVTRTLADDVTRELVRVSLDGSARDLPLAAGELMYAELLEGDESAVLVATSRATGALAYQLIGLRARDDLRGVLPVDGGAMSMAYLPVAR